MEIILLAIIATLLALGLLNDVTKGEDPIVLVVGIPMLIMWVTVGAVIFLLIAWVINALMEMFSIYL